MRTVAIAAALLVSAAVTACANSTDDTPATVTSVVTETSTPETTSPPTTTATPETTPAPATLPTTRHVEQSPLDPPYSELEEPLIIECLLDEPGYGLMSDGTVQFQDYCYEMRTEPIYIDGELWEPAWS